MYSKFNLRMSDGFYNREVNQYFEAGRLVYKDFENKSKKCLKEFILDNGRIDGTAVKEYWFQMENVDVFLSHSHDDKNKVIAFSGWLKEVFGLTSFVDSCVWGYCDDLLKEIDNEYCWQKQSKTYNYNMRNYSTSHVHMMLSIALSEMIDRTECIIFFNTPKSVEIRSNLSDVKRGTKAITLSPWIYNELAITSTIRQMPITRGQTVIEHAESFALNEKRRLTIEYDIDKFLGQLLELTQDDLIDWKKNYQMSRHMIDGGNTKFDKYSENTHPLDILYNERCVKYKKEINDISST